ncbi:hypothetical protein EJMOOK_14395 [Rhodanobacter sp. Root179]
MPVTLRADPPPARRCRGAPGRAAGHRGPHFSEEPDQEQSGGDPELLLRLWSLLLHFSFITECGPRWPAALPGVPCAAVRRGRQAAQRALPRMATPFRTGRMPVRKARPRLTDLPDRSPASAKRGVVFSWLLLFWTSKREVTRPPKEDESLCSDAQGRAKAPLKNSKCDAGLRRNDERAGAPLQGGSRHRLVPARAGRRKRPHPPPYDHQRNPPFTP